MTYQRIFLFLMLTLGLVSAVPTSKSLANHTPDGLSTADWAAIQTLLPSDYFKASNTEAGDLFGSVAVEGDTVVVGAVGEDSNATGVNGNQANNSAEGSGAVYVFTRSGGVWSQQAYLKASNTEAGDHFGTAVALANDTLVVGAYGEDSNATGVNGNQADNSASNSGAAYVFTRHNGIWSQQAYLKASNTGAEDEFGFSVAISGDTVVVGAFFEDSNATGINGNQANNSAFDAGAAYVFTRHNGIWSQQAYIKASNTDLEDQFGVSVAIAGDTVVVGAYREDSNATGVNGNQANNSTFDAGAAYVFTRHNGIWSQQAYLKASNTDFWDNFGVSVSISGQTVAVGAHGESSNATGVGGNQTNNSAPDSGAAYVFTRSEDVWSQQAYIKASNTDVFDVFGYRLAIAGDTLVIGAPFEGSQATGINGNQTNNAMLASGAAYVFTRSGGVWSQQAYLKASNTDIDDWFSRGVATSGDTVVVGALFEDSNAIGLNGNQNSNSASNAGAVYVFANCIRSLQTGAWEDTSTWVGSALPLTTSGVCIEEGHTVTMNANAAVDQLWVYKSGTLDIRSQTLTVEKSISNNGTLRQNRMVNGTEVHFLHIQNAANTLTHYRGVVLDGSLNGGNHLGNTTVSVRELNAGEYCTNTGVASPAYARRCFDISPAHEPATPVLVRLYGRTADELNHIDESLLAVYHNSPAGSGVWVEQLTNATNGNDGGAYSYAQAEVADFSPFLLGEIDVVPTAVALQQTAVNQPSGWGWLAAVLALSGLSLASFWRRQGWSVRWQR